jgi:hypothetical protein
MRVLKHTSYIFCFFKKVIIKKLKISLQKITPLLGKSQRIYTLVIVFDLFVMVMKVNAIISEIKE